MAHDPLTTSQHEAANKRATDRRKAQEEAKKNAVAQLDERDKVAAEARASADERASKGRPTPTQRENDLAKLGVLGMDEKEDDGSGPDTRQRVAEAGGGDAPYRTREAAPVRTPTPQPGRKPE